VIADVVVDDEELNNKVDPDVLEALFDKPL
jgi:hypothetical protein